MKKKGKLSWYDENLNKYNITIPMVIKIWRKYNKQEAGEIGFDEELNPPLPHIDNTNKIPRNKKFRKLIGKKYLSIIEKNKLNLSNLDLNDPDRKILLNDADDELEVEEDKKEINNVKSFLFRFRGKAKIYINNLNILWFRHKF